MKRRRIPAYRLHKSSGHARVKVNGRELFLGRYNSPESLEKYQRLVAELVASNDTSETVAAVRDDLTVVETVARYLNFAQDYYRHSDELENIKKALRPLCELYGRTPASQFGPRALKALRKTLIDANLTRRLINQRVQSIVRIFRWASSEQMVPPHIFQALGAVEGLRRGFTEAKEGRKVKPVSDKYFIAFRRSMWRPQSWRLTAMSSGPPAR